MFELMLYTVYCYGLNKQATAFLICLFPQTNTWKIFLEHIFIKGCIFNRTQEVKLSKMLLTNNFSKHSWQQQVWNITSFFP